MTTDVKFFSSEMAGAPVVSGTKGSLLSMIDACLVTGFGLQAASTVTVVGGIATVALNAGNFMLHSIVLVAGATPAGLNGEKRVLAVTGASSFTFDATGIADGVATGTITVKVAPLGWLKPFSGTDTGVYKIDPALHPDTTGCLVRIADTGTYNAKISGYESMTDVDNGAAAFPTVAQQANGLWVFRSNAANPNALARNWFVVGDSRFVYVGVRATADSYFVDYGPCWFSFGEFKSKKSADPFRFAVSGNYPIDTTQSPGYSYSLATTDNSYAYAARPYTGLGGGQQITNKTWPQNYQTSGGASAPLDYPNGPDYGLILCKAQLFEGRHYRGDWPGMRFIPQNVMRKICPDIKTGYYDTEVPGFENKVVGFFPCTYNSADWGVVAFDLTGPWEH